jgi:hypothetical protein
MGRFIVFLMCAFAVLLGANFIGSYYYPGGYLFAQPPADKAASVGQLILLAALMLFGIISSFVFERAKQSRADGQSISKNLSAVFSDFRLIAALFVSPIIFNSVYSLVHQNPESISDFLLAYQNGFFWQAVISGIAGRQPAQARRRT